MLSPLKISLTTKKDNYPPTFLSEICSKEFHKIVYRPQNLTFRKALTVWHTDLKAGTLRGCNAWKALAKAINT